MSKSNNDVGVARPEPRPAVQLSCTGREQRRRGGKQSRTVDPYTSGNTLRILQTILSFCALQNVYFFYIYKRLKREIFDNYAAISFRKAINHENKIFFFSF